MTASSQLVIVGEIVRPFGRMGEVKIRLDTDFPEAFAERRSFILTGGDGTERLVKVETMRFHQGAALVKFEGVSTISDAEDLRGYLLAIRSEERPDLGEGSFWVDEVIGLEVVREDGRSLGAITEVLRGKANDVWITDVASIPVIKDVVLSVDMDKRQVIVRAIEGLETQ